jgi:branched-chain amino acid transport system permease protein
MELAISYLDQILIFTIFALSLNLLTGYAGQVSVAHAAFGAVGGYALAYLFLAVKIGTLEGIAVAVGASGLVGLIVGIPALRLKTEWLMLLTLAAQMIVIALVSTSAAFGGTYGLQSISGLTLFGHALAEPSDFLPLFAVCATLVYAICRRFGESPYGRVLRAIREDETACRSLGKDVFRFKTLVFAVTAAMAGLAGALLVIDTSIASPTLFGFDLSSAIVAMVVVGGAGNLAGSVLGATALVLLGPLFERVLNFSADSAFTWRLVAFGAVLVLIMMFRPQGLLPAGASPMRRFTRKLRRIPEHVLPSLTGAGAPLAPGRFAPPSIGCVFSPEAPPGGHPPQIVLAVRGLSKRFGGIVAADDLDLELRRGTITALVGPNGAGKTTVFNLLTGALRADGGAIRLNGDDISGLRPDEIAVRGMVRSYQNVRLFPALSAVENVMLAIQRQPGEQMVPLFFQPARTARAERQVRERALDWLCFVGIDGYAMCPAGALAFGQQKLVALARILATDASVVLLDEPASGIDQPWVDVMLSLIEELRGQGRTVCIVEHNLHVVERLADHTYFMELGRITAQGSFAELTATPRLAEAYFGTA